MVLAVTIDNGQRHCLSEIRLHLLFQWKWAATHQGNVKKTETEWAKKIVYMTTMHANRLAVPSEAWLFSSKQLIRWQTFGTRFNCLFVYILYLWLDGEVTLSFALRN